MPHKHTFFFIALFSLASLTVGQASESNSVIRDKANAIYWQDNTFTQKSSEDWNDAVAYCQALKLDGYSTWRLPTFKELLSIVDFNRVDPAINPVFSYVYNNTYWTSTTFSATRSRAWTIDFRTGKTYYSYKTTNHAVRCVKDISAIEKDQK